MEYVAAFSRQQPKGEVPLLSVFSFLQKFWVAVGSWWSQGSGQYFKSFYKLIGDKIIFY